MAEIASAELGRAIIGQRLRAEGRRRAARRRRPIVGGEMGDGPRSGQALALDAKSACARQAETR
jgi:hypothetical protein